MTIEQEARAEAEMRLDENAWMFRGRDAESGWFLNGFIKGAEWAASRPVTDADVEKAAKAMWFLDCGDGSLWDSCDEQPTWRDLARAALEAIRPTEGNPAAEREGWKEMPLSELLAEVRDGDEVGWTLAARSLNSYTMANLRESIAQNGQREPVHIGSDGRLWDGHHRVETLRLLGAQTILVIDDRPTEGNPT